MEELKTILAFIGGFSLLYFLGVFLFYRPRTENMDKARHIPWIRNMEADEVKRLLLNAMADDHMGVMDYIAYVNDESSSMAESLRNGLSTHSPDENAKWTQDVDDN